MASASPRRSPANDTTAEPSPIPRPPTPSRSPLRPQATPPRESKTRDDEVTEKERQKDKEREPGSPPLFPLRLTTGSETTPVTSLEMSSLPESMAEEAGISPLTTTVNRLTRGGDRRVANGILGGGGGRGRFRPVPEALWRAEKRRAAVGLRVLAAALSMVSFSVMAADKTGGWDGDSYGHHEEFRYALTVNAISFAYSVWQVIAELYLVLTTRHLIIGPPYVYYTDLFMDQILAYLLMSASSAAASHNDIWVSRFGGDEFTKKINVSMALSFFAFFALASSSIISTYVLFRWIS